jgi:hypothetical protein
MIFLPKSCPKLKPICVTAIDACQSPHQMDDRFPFKLRLDLNARSVQQPKDGSWRTQEISNCLSPVGFDLDAFDASF